MCTCLRLSVRAFTQLFDEDKHDFSASPLFTDTYLSLPMVTEAGEATPTPTITFTHYVYR